MHQYDVFISYSHADIIYARAMRDALELAGLTFWWDEELYNNPDREFAVEIHAALAASAKVLVLWSDASVKSSWVRGEADMALDMKKIVPLALGPLNGTDGQPTALKQLLLPNFRTLPMILWSDIAAPNGNVQLLYTALGATQDQGQEAGILAVIDPKVDISHLPETYAPKLFGRDDDMRELLADWDERRFRIAAFDAMGGAGKTALAYHFVQNLKQTGWRGARAVYAWSFYSQGSNEDRQASADEFFITAFKFFTKDTERPPKNAHEKGTRLAELIQRQRTLLVLDGMEPLQYATGRLGRTDEGSFGGIKDPGIKALLACLAEKNPGLCILTTRIEIGELKKNPGVRFEALKRLQPNDGVALLRSVGVEPKTPPEQYRLAHEMGDLPILPQPIHDDLDRVVEELEGHALALTLVGNYLTAHHDGDIRKAPELPSLIDLKGKNERSPYRVMRAIEIALANRIDELNATNNPASVAAGRQLAILIFLGLFDRPAERELLAVVFAKGDELPPPDPADESLAAGDLIALKKQLENFEKEEQAATRKGETLPESRRQEIKRDKNKIEAERDEIITARRRLLFRHLFKGFATWTGLEQKGEIDNALQQLAAQGLVSRPRGEDRWSTMDIDCHPLVREYFGERLKELDAAAYRTGHGRLYDHLRFKGLPTEFQNGVAYGLLADQVAFPDYGAQKTVDDLVAGSMNEQSIANTSPALVAASHDQLKTAAKLINGLRWQAALEAFLPEDEEGMNPLFSAIHHGCKAERDEECWTEVYIPRIARGNEGFAVIKLGLYGQELSALAAFFKTPFIAPSKRFSPARQTLLLARAAFRLRALGRLEDAVEPNRTDCERSAEQNDWVGTYRGYGNLCELLLLLGQIDGDEGAVSAGRLAIDYADRNENDLFSQLTARASNATPALLASGKLAEAESLSRHSERLQKQFQSELPQLYSTDGYQYAALLLARGRNQEVRKRGSFSLEVSIGAENLLGVALDELTKAQAALALFSTSHVSHLRIEKYQDNPARNDSDVATFPEPTELLELASTALKAMRTANNEDHLPSCLLVRAKACWRTGNVDEAAVMLREMEIIARRGPMPLFMAQGHLLRARICLDAKNLADALSERKKAAALIKQHHWHGAEPELAVLDLELAIANGENTKAELTRAIDLIWGHSYDDSETGQTIDGGWWGLLPRLAPLMLPDDPRLTELQKARDNYNHERDAYLAEQDAELQATLAQEWQEEDQALKDPAFRKKLSEILATNNIDMLNSHELNQQRHFAREYLQMKRQQAAPSSTANELPDEIIEQILANPEMLAEINEVCQQSGLPPLADLPEEQQKQAISAFIKAMIENNKGSDD